MMQPAELLQHFGVIRVSIKNSSVGSFCRVVLHIYIRWNPGRVGKLGNVRLSAAREHALFETIYLPRSAAVGDLIRCI